MRGDNEVLYEKFKLIAEVTADRWDSLTIGQVRELKELADKSLKLVERREGQRRG